MRRADELEAVQQGPESWTSGPAAEWGLGKVHANSESLPLRPVSYSSLLYPDGNGLALLTDGAENTSGDKGRVVKGQGHSTHPLPMPLTPSPHPFRSRDC